MMMKQEKYGKNFYHLGPKRDISLFQDFVQNKKNLDNYQNSGKIYVSNIEKIFETFLSIFDFIKLSFIYKKDDELQHNHDLINEEINLDERI